MSKGPEDEALRELVIVRRRRGGDHDGHHGGAWKIAYADFMTAMMAFFLVMWLVNMTDDKKIVQIAAYFNPLRLSEKTPSSRGLEDATPSDAARSTATAESSNPAGGADPKEKSKPDKAKDKAKTKAAHAEAELFVDPNKTIQAALDQAPVQPAAAGAAAKQWGHPSALSGKALLDPYDPVHRGRSPVPSEMRTTGPDQGNDPVPGPLRFNRAAGPAQEKAKQERNPPAAAPSGDAAKAAATTVQKDKSTEASPKAAGDVAETTDAASASRAAGEANLRITRLAATAVEREIRASMLDFKGPKPQVDIKATPEGVLVSVADDVEFGMFAVASAEPLPAAVSFMSRIADVLKDRPGRIVVRGHTDGRPYRTAAYDNWRLSTARAHMAQYMLVRAGLPADRIERVEGHADKKLINAKDKEAAQNRRIEFLLGVEN